MTKQNCNIATTSKQVKRGGRPKLTEVTFSEKANDVHGGKYTYGNVVYKTNKDKVLITCPIHGDFNQRPDKHLIGRGCADCASSKKSNTSDFILKAKKIHFGRYTYQKVLYVSALTPVLITCQIHGDFTQRPSDHLRGRGCSCCAFSTAGFGRSNFSAVCAKNNNGDGYLYVIKCHSDDEVFYKIGVTSRTVKARFESKLHMPYDYKVLFTIEGSSDYIYNLEVQVHRLLSKRRYTPNIYFDGRTECFTQITKPVEKLLKQLESTEQLQLIT